MTPLSTPVSQASVEEVTAGHSTTLVSPSLLLARLDGSYCNFMTPSSIELAYPFESTHELAMTLVFSRLAGRIWRASMHWVWPPISLILIPHTTLKAVEVDVTIRTQCGRPERSIRTQPEFDHEPHP